MDNITISIVELASTLAHKELLECVPTEDQLYEDPEAGITNYTEYFQDVFDDLYDKYYNIIDQIKQ